MKTPTVLLITLAASTLGIVPAGHAEPPARAKKRAQVAALMQDPNACQLACQEMMKDRAKKRYMAQVVAHDAEARVFYGAEVGSSAPHEERNPSDHPELFQAKRP